MTSNVVAIAQGRTALEVGLTGVPVHEVSEVDEVENLLAVFQADRLEYGLKRRQIRVDIRNDRDPSHAFSDLCNRPILPNEPRAIIPEAPPKSSRAPELCKI